MRARRTAVTGTRVFSHVYLREAESVLVSISPRPAVFHGVVARARHVFSLKGARARRPGVALTSASPLVLRRSRRWFPPRRVSSPRSSSRRGRSPSRPARARRSTSRRPTSTSACPPRSRGRTRCPSRTSARRSTVPPSRASSRDVAPLFRETGAALAPRRAPASDDPERRSLFPLAHAASRSRAPIERLPALTHPRPPLPPRSGTLAYPPSDKDACDPFGVRARRAPSSLSRRFPRAVVRSEEVLSFFRLLLRRRA